MSFIKSLLHSAIVAVSMYSKIPVPYIEWNEKNMRHAICFFPLVGVVIAVLEYVLLRFCAVLFSSDILRSCLMLFIPLAVTGGIHADGFMDTNDALCSYADREQRLAIMKDPHAGAFAVIHLVMYTVLFLGFASIVKSYVWCMIFILSRIFSGISVVTFKCAKKDGTLYSFASKSDRTVSVVIFLFQLVACSAVIVFLEPVSGAVCVCVALIVFWIYHALSLKKFGGITGDLAGWFLCNAELWMTAAFAITPCILRLWKN